MKPRAVCRVGVLAVIAAAMAAANPASGSRRTTQDGRRLLCSTLESNSDATETSRSTSSVNCSSSSQELLSVRIPKPISDHTATLVGDENGALIYLAGGCDDPYGNNIYDPTFQIFSCGSISDSFYAFDPLTEDFISLPPMPVARYRHAAVAIKNQLVLLGGRTLADDLIPQVDVFDMNSQSWFSFALSSDVVAASDLAFWDNGTHAFFAGGYDVTYTALKQVFSLHNLHIGAFTVTRLADLVEARGDAAGTIIHSSGYAYVGGGFTHEDNFCAPLASVERYSLGDNSWMGVADLPDARADMVLVSLQDTVVAMGGERQVEDICDLVEPEPSDLVVAVDDVSVLEEMDTMWRSIDSLAVHRFRFAAAVHNDMIYSFGGQMAYDEECECLATTDEVIAYTATSAPAPTFAPVTPVPTFPTDTPRDMAVRMELERVVGGVVNNIVGPYKMAMDWILYDDPMQLQQYDTNLVQRYILALFYYQTSQDAPWVSCNPPAAGESDTCVFYEYKRLDDGSSTHEPREESHIRWLSSKHECEWAEILCDTGFRRRVIAIDLVGQDLGGTMPSELRHLEYLLWLSLSFNQFSGEIPDEYGQWPYLTIFEVNSNLLTGQISSEIFDQRNLLQLDLSFNEFSGTLPSTIGKLTSLHSLLLMNLGLSGTVPTEIGLMEDLRNLWLYDNALLGGPVPSEIGQLNLLQEMKLGNSNFGGPLPSELGQLNILREFLFAGNDMEGSTIPEELWDLSSIEFLDFGESNFGGTIGTEIGKAWTMKGIKLQRNQLEGTLPSELGLLSNLLLLWVHGNELEGSVPVEVCLIPTVQYLNADCAGNDPPISCPLGCCTGCCDEFGQCQVV
ncbi:leucine Rich Repeat [Seminavis robusta]|uniref:Leucine Rich Repeat n=1 Tax=Seminavis robusta TaxID=568900 RepID=A0A9N8EYR5_9STRA|nr:leucine Rich Repeat [Seminavis robusta]|eukprot:Sro2453_g328180.1 leucine Rich Repeat (848) ;mRNA; r:8907-11776